MNISVSEQSTEQKQCKTIQKCGNRRENEQKRARWRMKNKKRATKRRRITSCSKPHSSTDEHYTKMCIDNDTQHTAHNTPSTVDGVHIETTLRHWLLLMYYIMTTDFEGIHSSKERES